jgi:hypothetical protein
LTRVYGGAAGGVRQGLGRVRVDAEDHFIRRRFRRNLSVSLPGTLLSLAVKAGQTPKRTPPKRRLKSIVKDPPSRVIGAAALKARPRLSRRATKPEGRGREGGHHT